VYNAVYRGDLTYFGSKYKAVVLSHLSARNAGISRRWDEWPGATRLLVPLTSDASEGRLSSLSTTELSEKKVIEELRKQPDMGLEERKDLVEFKEREIEEKQAALQAEEKRLEEARAELEKKEAELEAAKAPAEKAALEKQVAAQREEVRRAEEAVAEKKAEVAAKEAEVAEEREAIISDERSREALGGEARAPAAAGLADRLYYLKVRPREPSGSISGSLSILDPGPPEVKATSPAAYVRGRAFYFFKDSILVVAQEGSPNDPARLILLDPLSLKPVKRSSEEVYADSFVLIQGGSIYAVVKSGNEHRLARFDENLALAARSAAAVDRDSSLSLFADRIYVDSAARAILALDARDLSLKAQVR